MSLRAEPEFEDLARDLQKRARGGPLIFIQNSGNWGDAVIGAGHRAFFEHFRIPVQDFRMRWPHVHIPLLARILSRQMRPTILYGGNGGLGGHYPELVCLIRLVTAGAGNCVMLPSTYSSQSLPMLRPDARWTFWARDRFKSLDALPDARFCHDMAFFLDLPSISVRAGRGDFFRTDREAAGRPLPPGNRDISLEGTETTPITGFVKAIGQFEEVHTDRLHVAIVAAMLGRRTHLYANDYHKNAAIFRTSLAPFYPNVLFLGH